MSVERIQKRQKFDDEIVEEIEEQGDKKRKQKQRREAVKEKSKEREVAISNQELVEGEEITDPQDKETTKSENQASKKKKEEAETSEAVLFVFNAINNLYNRTEDIKKIRREDVEEAQKYLHLTESDQLPDNFFNSKEIEEAGWTKEGMIDSLEGVIELAPNIAKKNRLDFSSQNFYKERRIEKLKQDKDSATKEDFNRIEEPEEPKEPKEPEEQMSQKEIHQKVYYEIGKDIAKNLKAFTWREYKDNFQEEFWSKQRQEVSEKVIQGVLNRLIQEEDIKISIDDFGENIFSTSLNFGDRIKEEVSKDAGREIESKEKRQEKNYEIGKDIFREGTPLTKDDFIKKFKENLEENVRADNENNIHKVASGVLGRLEREGMIETPDWGKEDGIWTASDKLFEESKEDASEKKKPKDIEIHLESPSQPEQSVELSGADYLALLKKIQNIQEPFTQEDLTRHINDKEKAGALISKMALGEEQEPILINGKWVGDLTGDWKYFFVGDALKERIEDLEKEQELREKIESSGDVDSAEEASGEMTAEKPAVAEPELTEENPDNTLEIDIDLARARFNEQLAKNERNIYSLAVTAAISVGGDGVFEKEMLVNSLGVNEQKAGALIEEMKREGIIEEKNGVYNILKNSDIVQWINVVLGIIEGKIELTDENLEKMDELLSPEHENSKAIESLKIKLARWYMDNME